MWNVCTEPRPGTHQGSRLQPPVSPLGDLGIPPWPQEDCRGGGLPPSSSQPGPPGPRRHAIPRAHMLPSTHLEPDPLPLNGTLCKRPLFNPAPLSGLQMPAIIWYPSPPVHLFARLLICCLESLGGAGPPSRHRPRRVLPPFLVGIPGRTQVQNQPPP